MKIYTREENPKLYTALLRHRRMHKLGAGGLPHSDILGSQLG